VTLAEVPPDAVDVILRDGRTLRLRPPRSDDAGALLDFFRSLSERSLYLRFHGLPALGPKVLEPLLEPDWSERGALLGALAEDGAERIVGVANYVRLRDASAAEAAFAVADEYQRHGIGTRLLEQLAARASEAGIERFVAEVLADNRDMLVSSGRRFELSRGQPRRRARRRRACIRLDRGDSRRGRSCGHLLAGRGRAGCGAAEQALRKGVRALVVISAGFAEIGSEGEERQERLLALVRAHGARARPESSPPYSRSTSSAARWR
jgi:RimJ/RimL family protein N-acetyltransferase